MRLGMPAAAPTKSSRYRHCRPAVKVGVALLFLSLSLSSISPCCRRFRRLALPWSSPHCPRHVVIVLWLWLHPSCCRCGCRRCESLPHWRSAFHRHCRAVVVRADLRWSWAAAVGGGGGDLAGVSGTAWCVGYRLMSAR